MADRGHELTETILTEIEGRCKEEYEIAAREMRKKYRDYMKQFEAGRKEQYELWKAGKITKKDYTDWVYRHTMMGKRWEQMANVLAADMHNANDIAHAIAAGQMPDIFALNANYATFQIEHDGRIDTGFTLYSHDTAAYLMQDQQLMPGPSTKKAAQIAANKDMQWNYRKIQSAVMQGVLQGESPYEAANRLTSVAQMNYNAAVRYARTMGTNAQNAGRYEGYHRAKDLGVDLKIEWSATLDSRTRHEHRLLDGQRREVDEPFEVDGFKIMWPGQSSGPGSSDIPQELIWNCRCTLLAWVKGFEGETVKSSPKMGNMSYDEWKHAKEPKKKEPEFVSRFKPATTIKEAEEFAKNFCDEKLNLWGTGVNYTGIDVDVANRVNKTVVDLYDEFDVKAFGGIVAPAGNTREGKMISDAVAAYSSPRNSFYLNRKTFGTVKKAEKHFAESSTIIKDVLEHPEKYDLTRMSKSALEILNASKISGRDVVPSSIESALYHEFGHVLERPLRGLDNYDLILQNMADYAPKLSGYATSATGEYIAESFASWRLGEGLIDPELEKAFKLLRRRK